MVTGAEWHGVTIRLSHEFFRIKRSLNALQKSKETSRLSIIPHQNRARMLPRRINICNIPVIGNGVRPGVSMRGYQEVLILLLGMLFGPTPVSITSHVVMWLVGVAPNVRPIL